MSVNIIGISAFYHDAACCLLQDGNLVSAAEEERFSRIKADPSAPKQAIDFCLRENGLTLKDIDCFAYYEEPRKKLARQLWSGVWGYAGEEISKLSAKRVEYELREIIGYEGVIKYFDHHLSHAASSFFFSGFAESAILTVDGVGEWATTTYGKGTGSEIELFEQVEFPDSLGLLYSTITSYLGFGVNDGEYKVMGLAPYGKPVYAEKIRELVQEAGGGQYRLNMRYFAFLNSERMYSPEFVELFGRPPRRENADLEQFHSDVAKSMQLVLEEILLEKARYLHRVTGMNNLCMAGGVALNCVANGKILRNGPFKELFVQPAANDAGGCMGAAALAHIALTGGWRSRNKLEHVYLGPSWSGAAVEKLLSVTALDYKDFSRREMELCAQTARRLATGKVVGWFQGKMEFGPRALGGRSILADPRNPTMRERVNAMVKKREGFRPFAPAVLDHRRQEHFDLDHDSPFMLETCQVISSLDLPAITHVDGSARVQTVSRTNHLRFFNLLVEFEKLTGCPILLNTSFNIKGEPIVCSPEDALACFITTDIDTLVLEDYIIDREDNDLDLLKVLLLSYIDKHTERYDQLYTFI